MLEKFLNSNVPSKVTWKAFYESIHKQLSNQIIEYAKNNGVIYLGGKCIYQASVTEDDFNKSTVLVIHAELYFKEQFSDEKNIEVQQKILKKNYSEFDYQNDTDTLKTLQNIKENTLEEVVEKPIIPKQKRGDI